MPDGRQNALPVPGWHRPRHDGEPGRVQQNSLESGESDVEEQKEGEDAMFQIRPLSQAKEFYLTGACKSVRVRLHIRRLQLQLAAATPTQKDLGRLRLRK